jgi:ATPase subunit of ABC transporter with duplicated ATPase domains
MVVSHDRYFLERVCDVTYALMGDGTCVLLPGGVDQYLEHRRSRPRSGTASGSGAKSSVADAATTRQAKKDVARIESQLARLDSTTARLHTEMAAAASDYARLHQLQAELTEVAVTKEDLELAWLEAAEKLD